MVVTETCSVHTVSNDDEPLSLCGQEQQSSGVVTLMDYHEGLFIRCYLSR